ncbi:hypothetical protein [Streptosporangium subroseum]|uniref:hypothetical protein n=1 Tax=Streptosporangium subroseum TaxID=106412 RepID=UPI00308E7C29|nr:hypothetical protein OHB15_17560 [Streptosporangium subroseum]
MATGQAATDSRAGGHEEFVTEKTAERHDLALAVVQRMLRVRGVRSYVAHTIDLKLSTDGRPIPLGRLQRHVPELVVHGNAGWVVAAASVGPRSGSYLVSVRDGRDLATVPSENPEKVANLILSTQFGGGS